MRRTRRGFLGGLAGGALLPGAEARPNFLILHTDDQRFDTIQALGNREILTPNLDRLAARGVVFTQATTQGGRSGAICMPSRAQMLTGCHVFDAHRKIVDRQADPDPGLTTVAEELRRAGYQTFHTGKWHVGPALHARSFTAASKVFFGGMTDPNRMLVQDFDPAGTYGKSRAGMASGYASTVIADAAIEYLRSRPKGPFLAYAAFTSPHDPRTAPERFARMYDPAKLTLPPNFLPEHPFDNGELKVRDELLAGFPRRREEVLRHLADYYAMVTEVDHEIGRIVAALDDEGLSRNTYILFAGDNGLAVGQHGLMGKQNLYEHSLRVPMMMAGPGLRGGSRRDGLYQLMDVAPTVARLAGVPMTGRAGIDLLTSKGRASAYAVYRDVQRALRTRDWKLVLYRVQGRATAQLFDLQRDPWERENVLDANRARARRMHGDLVSQLRADGDAGDWSDGFGI